VTSLEVILFYLIGLLSFGGLGWALWHHSRIKRQAWVPGRRVSVRELALLYESRLEGLHRVVAVGDRLEDPAEEPELRRSVIANFKRGIPYIFVVSRDRFESERTVAGYYDVFRAYARRALEESEASGDIDAAIKHLVRIVPLQRNWNHVPVVFYHCVSGRETSAYALRGDQVGHGISNGYVCLGRHEAAITYSAIVETIDAAHRDLVSGDLAEVEQRHFEGSSAPPLRIAR